MTRPDRNALWRAALSMQRHAWEQGVLSHAALDEGDSALAHLIAIDAAAHQSADGRLAATGDAGLVNGGSLCEVLAHRALSGDESAAQALERQRWFLLRYGPRDDSGVLWHLEGTTDVWVDSVYMVVPALAVTGDFAPADMQYRMHREHLWDPATGLYRHRVNTVTGEHTRGDLWATGSGWVAAGLARALRIGGENTPAEMRGRWQRQVAELLDACAQWERPDGRFHDVMNDSNTFVDGTAGLMLGWASLVGVKDGWLGPAYADRGNRWIDAALDQVDENGFVREVCGAPHFVSPGISAEAQAFALLAMSAQDALNH